jgi:adenine deaminase
MAAPLVTCTKEEQLSVIRFLISEGVKPIEVYRMASFLITETQDVPDAAICNLQGRLC